MRGQGTKHPVELVRHAHCIYGPDDGNADIVAGHRCGLEGGKIGALDARHAVEIAPHRQAIGMQAKRSGAKCLRGKRIRIVHLVFQAGAELAANALDGGLVQPRLVQGQR